MKEFQQFLEGLSAQTIEALIKTVSESDFKVGEFEGGETVRGVNFDAFIVSRENPNQSLVFNLTVFLDETPQEIIEAYQNQTEEQ